MGFPTTAIEFEERFATEEACEAYQFEIRWPDGFVCLHCCHHGGWQLWTRKAFECCGCGRQTSLTSGTVFHGTRKSLRCWFKAMFMVATQKNGASAMNVKRQLGVHYETAWTWLHKLRASMGAGLHQPLTGRVETDECFVGGEETGTPGRGAVEKALVSVAVEVKEKSLGRARMSVLEDASQASLGAFVSENVAKGAAVTTDAWRGYGRLGRLGFVHYPHVGGKGKAAAQKLRHVHLVIALLRRVLLGTYQGAVSKRHLQSYLNEFVFRFNRRTCRFATGLFERLVRAGITSPCRATFRSIVQLQHAKPLVIAA